MSREELLAAAREVVLEGLVVSPWGNLSLRISDDSFLITPSGVDYKTMDSEDLVEIGLDGNIKQGKLKPSSEYQLHLEIYKARRDIRAIVHTHSPYASAFAVARKRLPAVIEDLAQIVGGDVEVAKYALPGTGVLARNAVLALGNKFAVLLANHGVVGVGRNMEEALRVVRVVEKGAKVFLLSTIIGGPVLLEPEEIQVMHDFYLNKYGQR
ncbi:class II aldolase/adducin family protein [Carboxydothermus hydrogenoformans]|uniref:L-fuculose phosphate aldolase n=1 Tax=Carboxydothermus hydrogenoformans (strain ATCC BAA-161 / DSM 6008 / Z-2901) TaxID=246194 RepID=Q3ABU7_CARHZ|nr:class II aldolase/adducin family protein [Carboxydothermus hydrogenoformans]ABB15549.1 L-fuculose phosphate aldolase [Carboxydothermus hydrogenoformans Z-2901]